MRAVRAPQGFQLSSGCNLDRGGRVPSVQSRCRVRRPSSNGDTHLATAAVHCLAAVAAWQSHVRLGGTP
jgi:hypothetical protein